MTNTKYTTPCDLCRYDPPSSLDGKPCSMCPASVRDDLEFESEDNSNDWISVKDRLPTKRGDYFVIQNAYNYSHSWVNIKTFIPKLTVEDYKTMSNYIDDNLKKYLDKPIWYGCDESGIYISKRVTHWMSIPPIPNLEIKE